MKNTSKWATDRMINNNLNFGVSKTIPHWKWFTISQTELFFHVYLGFETSPEVATLIIKWVVFFCDYVSDFPDVNWSSSLHLIFVFTNTLQNSAMPHLLGQPASEKKKYWIQKQELWGQQLPPIKTYTTERVL